MSAVAISFHHGLRRNLNNVGRDQTTGENQGSWTKRAHVKTKKMQEEKASGLKSTLHGTVYQLKLLMLFLKRGLNEKYSFKLFTELASAGKFDDLIFLYEKDNETLCRFLQAKHSQVANKKITATDLLTEKGEFSLKKYFNSYRNIRKSKDFEGIEKDFVICTNIDIEKSLQSCFQEVDDESNILKFNNETSRLLKFDINKSPIQNQIAEKLKSCSAVGQLVTVLVRWTIEGKMRLSNDHIFYSYPNTLKNIIQVTASKTMGKKRASRKIVYCVRFREEFLMGLVEPVLSKAFCEAVKKRLKITSDEMNCEEMKKDLKISDDFAKKFVGSTMSEVTDTLPDDSISVEEIECFFKHLIFAVSQPNEVELDEIIQNELSEDAEFFNMLSIPLIASAFEKFIFDWMKGKGNAFLTDQDGAAFFKEAKYEMSRLALRGQYLELRAIIKNFDIVFDGEPQKLKEFLFHSNKKIFNFVNPYNPLLSSFKIMSLLDKFEGCQNNANYIFKSLKSLLLIKNHVMSAFKKSCLLIIECKENEENIDDLFNELLTEVEQSANKKIILITKEGNYLADKFKGKFYPDNYEEERDELNKLSDLTLESQEKLLSERKVLFQGEEINLKLLIDGEAKKLIDGEILLQLIKGEKIKVGIKRPVIQDLDSIYNILSVKIDLKTLSNAFQKNGHNIFVFIGFDEDELSKIIPDQDFTEGRRICLFGNDTLLKEDKYVILRDEDDENSIKNFKQICSDYSIFMKTKKDQFSAYLIRKKDKILTLIRSYNSSIYINRKLHPIVIKKDSFGKIINKVYKGSKEKEKRDIFAISNITEDKFQENYKIKTSVLEIMKKTLKKNHIYILKNNTDGINNFKSLCKVNDLKTRYNIHWLKSINKTSKSYLVWKRSVGELGEIDKLRDPDCDELYIEENDLTNKEAVIIAGDSGTGKSSTLSYLLGKPNKSEWIIRLDLINLEKQLSKLNPLSNIDDFIKNFFAKINIGVEGTLAKLLFKHKIKHHGNITFFIDGFDEITASSQETVIALLKLLKMYKVKFRITARLPHEDKLEKNLLIPSYKFKPFTLEDQKKFFYKFWQTGLKFFHVSNSKIFQSPADLYKKLKDTEMEVMSNPMLARIFAKVYQDLCFRKKHKSINIEELRDINFSQSYLYERFVSTSFVTYLKEKQSRDTKDYITKRIVIPHLKKNHQDLAFRKLFSQYGNLLTEKYERLSTRDKNYFTSIGIVKVNSNETDLYFTHNTFAEYFVAEFLVRMIKKTEDHPKYKEARIFLLKKIVNDRNELIKHFIDEIMERENLVSKWEEIQDCDLIKKRGKSIFTMLCPIVPTEKSLSEFKEEIDKCLKRWENFRKSTLAYLQIVENFPKIFEGFIKQFLEETNSKELKTSLRFLLNFDVNKFYVNRFNDIYSINNKIGSAVMHYFNQTKQCNEPVTKNFEKTCIEKVIGTIFGDFKKRLKRILKYLTKNNIKQLIDFFIPSEALEPEEWIKLNNLYRFLEIFHPDVIEHIKSYISSDVSAQKDYGKRILNSLVNTKFPSEPHKEMTFPTAWNLSSLQSLFIHIISNPNIIKDIKSWIEQTFQKKDIIWLMQKGTFISKCLQILTVKMSRRFTSPLSGKHSLTITYSKSVLVLLIRYIADALREEELPHVDKVAFLMMLQRFFKFHERKNIPIALTRKELQSVLQSIKKLLSETNQTNIVLISNYLITLGKVGLKLFYVDKKLIVFHPVTDFQFEFLSNDADLIMGKIRGILNPIKSLKNIPEKSCENLYLNSPRQKRKSTEITLTESKKPRVELESRPTTIQEFSNDI